MTFTLSSALTVPAAATTTCVGLWKHITSTTASDFLGMWAIGGTPYEYYLNGTDSYIYVNGHTFAVGEKVLLLGTTVGGGLTAGEIKYVKTSATGKITLASTLDGTEIVLTATANSSDAYIVKAFVDTYAAGGTFTVTTFDVALPW